MGSKLSKRLSKLEQQTEGRTGRFGGFGRWFILSFLALTFSILVIGNITSSRLSEELTWKQELENQFTERYNWLKDFPITGSLSANIYFHYSRYVAKDLFGTDEIETALVNADGLDETLRNFQLSSYQLLANIFLRLGFIIISMWPIWAIAGGCAYYHARVMLKPKRSTDLLGVCDPGKSPFYSGIYGPLSPNNSVSGTDFSCPSLATPEMAPKHIVEGSKLLLLLRSFAAVNRTNYELIQIILAHRDYPAVVDYEHPAEATQDKDFNFESNRFRAREASITSFLTNEEGTLEQSALEGLESILHAHTTIRNVISKVQPLTFDSFQLVLAASLAENKRISPLTKALCGCLTPQRAKAFAELAPQIVASSYLGIEAGKSLVYNRHDGKFVKISRYPHLQARAVIQSLVSYHEEYNGDIRQIIRQAIICSRRHGDFGRAFTPVLMPIQSRALRDLLEVLYSKPNDRIETADLVELDAHIEELSHNWQEQFINYIESGEKKADSFERGIPYKSVTLIPIETVLRLAWRGVQNTRRQRITELLSKTKPLQEKLSVSARLPGFKRQSSNIEENLPDNTVTKAILAKHKDREAVQKWIIIRRMLNRYNWLSTRVGDDGVPEDSLIQAVVTNPEVRSVVGLPALVPIRQRRFRELFGSRWERKFYSEFNEQYEISVVVDTNNYQQTLERQQAIHGSKSQAESSTSAA